MVLRNAARFHSILTDWRAQFSRRRRPAFLSAAGIWSWPEDSCAYQLSEESCSITRHRSKTCRPCHFRRIPNLKWPWSRDWIAGGRGKISFSTFYHGRSDEDEIGV